MKELRFPVKQVCRTTRIQNRVIDRGPELQMRTITTVSLPAAIVQGSEAQREPLEADGSEAIRITRARIADVLKTQKRTTQLRT